MKQKTYKFCIMLIAFAMLPSMGEAKKIQYGQLVTYNGKVNNDGLPDGNVIIDEDKETEYKKLTLDKLQNEFDYIFFSGETSDKEKIVNVILSKEKSRERTKVLQEIYDKILLFRENESETERGKLELALAKQIKERMYQEGYKTFADKRDPDTRGGLKVSMERLFEMIRKDDQEGLYNVNPTLMQCGLMLVTGYPYDIRAGLCKIVDASFANDIEAKEFLEDPEGYLNRIDETGEITKVADLYNNRVYMKAHLAEKQMEQSHKINEAKRKKEKEEEKVLYETLCKQFGKKYVDAALKKQIMVGMPEKLMVKAFDAKLYGQSGNKKTYRIYGYGSRERLDGSIYISNDHHLMTVWVSGGKVTSFRKWE